MKNLTLIERVSEAMTQNMGTPLSILIHTFVFAGIFSLVFTGFSLDQVLLILTTALSIEAIYLALFIQMTVNKHGQTIGVVEDNIDEIGGDINQIEENIDNIEEGLGDISEDIEEIQEDISEDDPHEKVYASRVVKMLSDIQNRLDKIEQNLHKD